MNDKIPIHWLQSQTYCEYQICLEHVKGVKVEPTPEMNYGKEAHAILEENHKKKAISRYKAKYGIVISNANDVKKENNIIYVPITFFSS